MTAVDLAPVVVLAVAIRSFSNYTLLPPVDPTPPELPTNSDEDI